MCECHVIWFDIRLCDNFSIIFYWMILILTLGSVIGMILNRNLLLKFFLCFESFFFIMSIIIIIWSCSSNGIIIILYLLWNSTFEVILGLTMSYLMLSFMVQLIFEYLLDYFILIERMRDYQTI